MSHRSSVPDPAQAYFGPGVHPTISQVFWPGKGWCDAPWKGPKAVSVSALRKLRAQGATDVQLTSGDRCPDFSLQELLARPKAAPLLGGSLIGSRTQETR